MAEKYYIIINGEKVSVFEEVYIAHRQMRRRERTLHEKEQRNFVMKYEDFSTGEMSGEEQIYDPTQIRVEDIALSNLIYRKLYRAICLLSPAERGLIMSVYFNGNSLQSIADKYGVHRMTIYRKMKKVLEKLKCYMEAENQ